jgi:hypothetical protein
MRTNILVYPLWQNGCKWFTVSPACCDWIRRKEEQFSCRDLWSTSLYLWIFRHWCQQFTTLCETLQRWKQGHRSSPSQLSTTECNEQKVGDLITVKEIVAHLGIGYSFVQEMVKSLEYPLTLHTWYRGKQGSLLGKCFLVLPIVGSWPLRTTACPDHWTVEAVQ